MWRAGRVVAAAMTAALAFGSVAATEPDSGSTAGWYRVNHLTTITDADRELLADVGARAVEYVPTDAYVAWLDHDAASLVATSSAVADVHLLRREEKLDPFLAGWRGPLLALVSSEVAQDAADTLGSIGAVAAVREADTLGALHEVLFHAGSVDAATLAARPEVRYVGRAPTGPVAEDESTTQIIAGNLNGASPRTGYEAWLAGLDLDGMGVRVSVVDTGVSEDHPDLAGRVAARVDYSSSPTGEPADIGGHGTHVAGIIAGNATGLTGAMGPRGTDSQGFLHGLGVAPAAEIVNQNVIAQTYLGSWPPAYGWPRLTRDAIDNGASIWNASWTSGEGVGVGYNASARTMDGMARDGHDGREGNQPFTLVFSAGNSGVGANDTDTRLTAPKEAKNIIAVAASNAARAGHIDQLASFSSRGPTRDGRVAPQVTAPGASITSTRTMRGVPGVSSCAIPLADADGALYASCSGTSMAAPHVAGSVALLTQWWRRANDDVDPTPAMSKALLVNSARDMLLPDVPNRHEGWGRIDLGRLFAPATARTYLDQTTLLGEVGDTHTGTVVVGEGDDLRVTLAWTDAPGAAGATSALVNDLDLVVTGPDGTVWHGNVFDGGRSVTGGAADRIDNLENVFLPTPGAGAYTVTVRATNVPGDGVPGNADLTDQDFALVTSVARR